MPFVIALIWASWRTAVKMKNEINALKRRILNHFHDLTEEPQSN